MTKKPIEHCWWVLDNPCNIYNSIHETYFYYDRPILFSKKNPYFENDYSLINLVDETDKCEIWISVDLTGERLTQIKNGEIPLRDAWEKAEYGVVAIIKTRKQTGTPISKRNMWAKDLTDDLLPVRGVTLNG